MRYIFSHVSVSKKMIRSLIILGIITFSSVFVSFFIVGCKREKEKLFKMLKDFEETRITIPQDMIMIQNGELRPYDIHGETPIFIIYVSPAECSSCRISHLDKYEDLFSMADSLGFLIMIILSPNEDQREYIQDLLIQARFHYPVYIDSYSEFANQNIIPEDNRFHSFLINSDNNPIFVGDPTANDRMHVLFSAILTGK